MTHRRRTGRRNQLVLNFARPEVERWALGWLDRLFGEHGVDFLKWDMNRPFTEAGRPGGADEQRLWTGHTEAVYRVVDAVRARHPGLRVESCAGGGGRVDLGMMRRADPVWTSDNTDPVDRIPIQHGYAQVYPAVAMSAWATGSPNPVTGRVAPLRFRFHVAMGRMLGVSGELLAWSADERAEAARLVADYKRIRPVVTGGRPAPAGVAASADHGRAVHQRRPVGGGGAGMAADPSPRRAGAPGAVAWPRSGRGLRRRLGRPGLAPSAWSTVSTWRSPRPTMPA